MNQMGQAIDPFFADPVVVVASEGIYGLRLDRTAVVAVIDCRFAALYSEATA